MSAKRRRAVFGAFAAGWPCWTPENVRLLIALIVCLVLNPVELKPSRACCSCRMRLCAEFVLLISEMSLCTLHRAHPNWSDFNQIFLVSRSQDEEITQGQSQKTKDCHLGLENTSEFRASLASRKNPLRLYITYVHVGNATFLRSTKFRSCDKKKEKKWFQT